MNNSLRLTVSLLLLAVSNLSAATLYVSLGSTNPTPPYTNWATAATSIQDAVDVANPGDQILVTNGVYQAGGRVVYGALTNRVAVNKAVVVQSVNGPAVTVIPGYQVTNQSSRNTNGYLSVRCVYVTNNATVNGFTLTNGGTWLDSPNLPDFNGGGAWCETNGILSNCVITANTASKGGGVYQGTCFNCMIVSNNSVGSGGGTYNSTLNNCTLTGNSASNNSGGGAYSSTLSNCTLVGNYAYTSGGGAYQSTLNNCTLIGNSLSLNTSCSGGGAFDSVLNNCTVVSNFSKWWGGGVRGGTLIGCTLTKNSSLEYGGGASDCTLSNCTLNGNSVGELGGGAFSSTLNNCTLTGNSAFNGGGSASSTMNNCLLNSNSAVNVGGGAELRQKFCYPGGEKNRV